MTQGVGLSVGATNVAAVIPGYSAVIREPAVPLGRGVVLTGFVDRVADPVGIMAADGTFHRGEVLVADALRALSYAATEGRAPIAPPGVAHPAHWRPAAVAALRRELSRRPEWSAGPGRLTLVGDASAALTALQAGPGLPTRGVVALCDFGGTGTSITLADAADGYRPIGATVRHPDFSGELVDRALLARVLDDLSIAGSPDAAGTSAIGALHRIRSECRTAKEHLSRSAVTRVRVDSPGYRGDVRLTRAELDDEICGALMSFVDVLREHLFRNRIHLADLTAVATVGGGASIPTVTTTLSDQLRVPVITTRRPDLTAANGAAMLAARRPEDDSLTAVAAPVHPTSMRAIAWSEADDVPEIASFAENSPPIAGSSAARPAIDFVHEPGSGSDGPKADPWYRPILLTAGVFAAMVLVGTGAVIALRNDASAMAGTTTAPVAPAPVAPTATPQELAAAGEQVQAAPSYIQAAPTPKTRIVTPPPVVMRAPAPVAAPPPAVAPAPEVAPPPAADPPTPIAVPSFPLPPIALPPFPLPPIALPPLAPPPNATPSSEPPVEPPSSPPSTPPSSQPAEPPPADPPPAQEEPPVPPADQTE